MSIVTDDHLSAAIEAARNYRPPARTERAVPPLAEVLDEIAAQPSQPRAVVLACGTELESKPVDWVWFGWIAAGKVQLLAGAPGQGKTTIAMSFGAIITRGGRWPDGTRCTEPGNILVWSGEDDPADTLLPRLLAAGADRGRCYFVQGVRDTDGVILPFDPATDLPRLADAIEQIGGIKLLVIDPIVSAVTGDSHKNTEVRRCLQPVVDLAAADGFAILGITHFSKGGAGGDPTQRVIGSTAFAAVARLVMVAAKVKAPDGDDADVRILARSKSNIGPDDGGFEYSLEQAEPMPGIEASYVVWSRAVTGTARELLTDPGDESVSEASNAASFLESLLADGPVPAKAIYADAEGAGFSRDQIKRAATKAGIERRKAGMNGGWVWALPSQECAEGSTKGAKGAPFKNVHSSHSSVLPSGDSADAEGADFSKQDIGEVDVL